MLRSLIGLLFSLIGSIITDSLPGLYRAFAIRITKGSYRKNMTQDKEPDLMPAPLLTHYTRLKIGPGLMLELLTLAQQTTKLHPELPGPLALVQALTSKSPTPDIISTSQQGPKT